MLKLFSLAIFLPSFQSIWKLQSLAEEAAIASYDMFDGELLMQYKYFSILHKEVKKGGETGLIAKIEVSDSYFSEKKIEHA